MASHPAPSASATTGMEAPPSPGLIRGLGKWDLTALVINMFIGAGIFGLPSKVFVLAGPYSLLAYALCALLAGLIILCFAEVGSRFTETGGPYLYARTAFGSWVGFEMGWLMWLARVTSFAALCNLLVGYLGFFWPLASTGAGRSVAIVALVAIFTSVNILGLRETARMSNALTVGKVLPLLLFVGVGLFFIEPGRATQALEAVDFGTFSQAVLLLVFAFSGFEMAVIPAGEARDPRRHIPFALLFSIAGVAALYILIQFVCMGTLPGLASSQRPLADAAAGFLGPAGASLIALGALISIAGTLNAILLAASRLLFAMGEKGHLPAALAAAHPRFRTPHAAILASALPMLALALAGSFLYALTLSTLIKLLTFAVVCLSLPVLRRRKDIPEPAFRLWGGPFLALASLGLCGWLLSSGAWRETRDTALAAGLGLVVYGISKARRMRAH